jgi:hypothetical protein
MLEHALAFNFFVTQDDPLSSFRPLLRDLGKELLCLEGRADYSERWACPGAGCSANPTFRCQDCAFDALWCASCLVNAHMDNPLHRVEVRRHLC